MYPLSAAVSVTLPACVSVTVAVPLLSVVVPATVALASGFALPFASNALTVTLTAVPAVAWRGAISSSGNSVPVAGTAANRICSPRLSLTSQMPLCEATLLTNSSH